MYKNILKYGVSEGLAKLVPFLTALYIANYLSPELYGKYSLVVVSFEIIFILVSINIQATTRIDFFKQEPDDFNRIKQNHLSLSAFVGFSLIVGALFLGGANGLLLSILVISALMRSVSCFLQAIFQCSKRVNSYIFCNLIFVFSFSGGVILFVNLGGNYYSWLYAMLCASAVQLLIALNMFGVAIFYKSFFPRELNLQALKYTFIPAILFMPQAVGWWLKSGADRAIISQQLGNAMLGNYSLAFQISSLILISAGIFNLAFVPELNKLIKTGERKKVSSLIIMGVTFFAGVTVFVTIAGQFILTNYFLADYGHVNDIFMLLCFSMLPQAIMLLLINILYYRGSGLFVGNLIFFSFLFQVMLNYFFVSVYGIVGLIINSFIINCLTLLLVQHKVKVFSSNKD